MATRHVIDGYNLLYALGELLHHNHPAGVLHRARAALLARLHAVFGEQGRNVTVVFDAAHAPRGSTPEHVIHGIHVLFAVHDDQADDLIEKLVKKDANPKQLIVVSDDHRIQTAATRRRCQMQGCQAFLDWLDQEQAKKPPEEKAALEKAEVSSDEETALWVREFGDLDKDPAMKELFEPFDFGE